MASTPYNFRLNQESDKHLIDMLENASNKSELIKNALFHYFIHIAKGEIIDRELPIGWGWDTFSNLIPPPMITTLPQNQSKDSSNINEYENVNEDIDDEEYEYEEVDEEEYEYEEEYSNVNVDIEV